MGRFQQCAPLGLTARPGAASHKMQRCGSVNTLLAMEETGRQVAAMRSQKRTAATLCGIAAAIASMMTYRRDRPHIVHRPHNRLSQCQKASQLLQRDISLINPMQVYHIGLLHQRVRSNAHPCRCRRDGKELLAAQTIV